GSALSPITYCLYNSGALESAESERSRGFRWINDLNLFAWGKTVSDAVANLRSRMPQLEAWSASHKSQFEPSKSDLVLFLPPAKPIPPTLPPLLLNDMIVPYSPTLTMLGAVLDSRLTFDAHVAHCAAKSSTALTGVKALLGARNGVTMRLAKPLVEAVVEPRRNWMARPDTIPNHFLQLLWPALRLRIVPLCAAILRLGHLPRSWRDATGMVLRKPKKPDYTHPKAYRLISFARTTAKLVEKVVTSRLSYLGEKYALLAMSHFGGREGRAAVEAVAAAVDVIKRQHRNGNHFVLGLAVDIAGAFPSPYSSSLTMLGTVIDERLTFEPHVALCAAKASTALNGVSALLSARSGVTMQTALETAAALLGLRALSAPPSHPLHTPTRLAAATPAPKYPSPLHTALASPFLPSFPQPLEQLDPEPVAPWIARPALLVDGVTAEDKAVERHNRILDNLQDDGMVAYTDGSETGGWSGAGVAVRVAKTAEGVLWGRKAVSMGALQGVYPAELVGINAAIASIPELFPSPSRPATLHVFADNASAVTDPSNPRARTAQVVRLDTFLRLQQLQLSHPGISMAAEWGEERERRATERQRLARAARQMVEMPRSVLDGSLTSIEDASEWLADEKSEDLNASRLRTGVHVDGECESCGDLETREHYLYHCPTYAQQRATLLSALPTPSLPPLSTLLSSTAFLPSLLTFLNTSDRFPPFHHPLQHTHTTTTAPS
ncbi:hypothetical protein JCM8097_004349, partial [Rhodosporidiobolus ruineniae]